MPIYKSFGALNFVLIPSKYVTTVQQGYIIIQDQYTQHIHI